MSSVRNISMSSVRNISFGSCWSPVNSTESRRLSVFLGSLSGQLSGHFFGAGNLDVGPRSWMCRLPAGLFLFAIKKQDDYCTSMQPSTSFAVFSTGTQSTVRTWIEDFSDNELTRPWVSRQ